MSERVNEQDKIQSEASEKQVKDKKRVVDLFSSAGKTALKMASGAKDAVVNTIDKNGDGKIDLKDLATVTSQLEEKRDRDRLEKEYNLLKPIFEDTINSPEFILPKLIRVAEMDKKHAESQTCVDSIGFKSEHDDIQIITVYPKSTGLFGLNFYPDMNSEIYYVDPCDRDHYIALDEYFKYLRLKKVNELQEIAQALGAKHFRVTYVEQEKSNTENKFKANVAIKMNASGEMQHESEGKKFNKMEVAAEMDCLGHEPTEPKLVYLKGDPNIEALIRMRMAKNAPIHQKVSVNLMSMSGIKVKDAAKIDGALKELHFGADGAIQKVAQSEANSVLEYEIDY